MEQETQGSQQQRDVFFAEASRFTPLLVADCGGSGRFLVSTGDGGVGYGLFMNGTRREMEVLERAVAVARDVYPGGRDVFVDIGANIGTTTVAALRCCGFNTAVSCEPEPGNFSLLKGNVALNGLDGRVVALPVAVSDHVGQARLVVNGRNSGANRVVTAEGRPAKTGREGETVEAVTVDALIADGTINAERVGLVWVDVQGHEMHVLAGAASLAALGVPVVIEMHPRLLKAAGSRDRIAAVCANGYTQFMNLRRPDSVLRPISELGKFVVWLESQRSHTDVLLIG